MLGLGWQISQHFSGLGGIALSSPGQGGSSSCRPEGPRLFRAHPLGLSWACSLVLRLLGPVLAKWLGATLCLADLSRTLLSDWVHRLWRHHCSATRRHLAVFFHPCCPPCGNVYHMVVGGVRFSSLLEPSPFSSYFSLCPLRWLPQAAPAPSASSLICSSDAFLLSSPSILNLHDL
jgi:hypothetical protein